MVATEKWESHTDIPVWEIQPVSDYTARCRPFLVSGTYKMQLQISYYYRIFVFQNALTEKIAVTDLMVLLRFMVAMILIMGQMLGNGVENPVVYVVITVRTIISLRL